MFMVTVSFIWIISGNLHEIVPPLQRLQCYFGCLNLCNVELISFKILSDHLLSVSGTDQILTLGKLNLVPYSARTFGQFYKNHARVKKDQNLILAFIDELWKTRKSEFWKNEKRSLEIIILHMCTKNHDHMRYIFWDKECDNFFFDGHFGSFFALYLSSPPTPPPPHTLPTPENQNFEKRKKAPGDVIIVNLSNKKHDQMMYAYSDMESDRHNFLSF